MDCTICTTHFQDSRGVRVLPMPLHIIFVQLIQGICFKAESVNYWIDPSKGDQRREFKDPALLVSNNNVRFQEHQSSSGFQSQKCSTRNKVPPIGYFFLLLARDGEVFESVVHCLSRGGLGRMKCTRIPSPMQLLLLMSPLQHVLPSDTAV